MILLKILFSGLFFILLSCSEKVDSFTVPDYKTWKKPVNYVLDTPVPGHGSTYRVIYANDIAFESKIINESSGRKAVKMKDGSIIIKEVYKNRADIAKKIPELVIMVKDTKNKKTINGWLYYMVEPGGEPQLIRGRMCVGCHEAANEGHPYFDRNRDAMFRDYLFVPIASELK